MHVFELTRRLIDIESITSNEREMGGFLFGYLAEIARRHNGQIERMPVEPGRDNVFVRFGDPIVTLTTHMDTVPPFIPSREDDDPVMLRFRRRDDTLWSAGWQANGCKGRLQAVIRPPR